MGMRLSATTFSGDVNGTQVGTVAVVGANFMFGDRNILEDVCVSVVRMMATCGTGVLATSCFSNKTLSSNESMLWSSLLAADDF